MEVGSVMICDVAVLEKDVGEIRYIHMNVTTVDIGLPTFYLGCCF